MLSGVQILVSVVTGLTVLSVGGVLLEAYRISLMPDDDVEPEGGERPPRPSPEPEGPRPSAEAGRPEPSASPNVISGTTPDLKIPREQDGPESMGLSKPTVIRGVPLRKIRRKRGPDAAS